MIKMASPSCGVRKGVRGVGLSPLPWGRRRRCGQTPSRDPRPLQQPSAPACTETRGKNPAWLVGTLSSRLQHVGGSKVPHPCFSQQAKITTSLFFFLQKPNWVYTASVKTFVIKGTDALIKNFFFFLFRFCSQEMRSFLWWFFPKDWPDYQHSPAKPFVSPHPSHIFSSQANQTSSSQTSAGLRHPGLPSTRDLEDCNNSKLATNTFLSLNTQFCILKKQQRNC